MGVDSTAILTRWLTTPQSRDFPLQLLTVLVAQTGDEWQSTKNLCETYILPLLRRHRIRLVQVARAGRLEEEGIEILDDSDQPTELFIQGAYKLSDELAFAGTVPQFAGVHTCALKFKGFVLDRWLSNESQGQQFLQAFGFNSEETNRIAKSDYADNAKRIAFGFNAEETKRVIRANEYNSLNRQSFYPLMEWNWTRADCLLFLQEQFHVRWKKSACIQCPFVSLNHDNIQRYQANPQEAAKALLLEYTSLCLNHRSTLYKTRSLMSVLRSVSSTHALECFRRLLHETPMATYRVRRIMTSKGHGYRCTERIDSDELHELIPALNLTPITFHPGDYDITTGYAIQRDPNVFPAREEFYVRAPATIASRSRYGIAWFEQKWLEAAQASLFQ